jgi:hypothetical protein
VPRPIRPWYRFYVETFNDRKIRRLTPTQRWVWVAVLGAARESPESGFLFIAEGVPMTHQELADYAGVKLREIGPALSLMESLSMVTVDANGLVSVNNWGSRQFESDDVTQRTRDYREHSRERSNVVPGNAPEPETETETDKELSFEAFWDVYPRRVAKGQARKAWPAATKKETADNITAAAASFAARVANADPKFIPHPATWLNGERWADDQPDALKVDDQGRIQLPPLPKGFFDQ